MEPEATPGLIFRGALKSIQACYASLLRWSLAPLLIADLPIKPLKQSQLVAKLLSHQLVLSDHWRVNSCPMNYLRVNCCLMSY
jgi:hypothetical protein